MEPGATVCDKNSGQCLCRENMDDLKCDKCKAGFYAYPKCEECDCHEEGSLQQICDPLNAQCLCKENTQGDRCQDCRHGTFNIEARNGKGCTQCFCFGQATYCRMSDLYYLAERNFNREEWRLAYAKQNNNQSNIKIEISTVDDGSDALKLSHSNSTESPTVYWSAPKSYIGNKVTSYGGWISYSLRIRMPTVAGSTSQVRPDLILVGHNMSLIHTSVRQPSENELFANKVDLLESQFTHLLTGSSASREQLMIVLSQLSELKLRATFYNRLHNSELVNFELSKAVPYEENVTTVAALSAEQCYCPPNFKGYSCESCEDGFYKVKSSGPGLFNCVPCTCNGHADICDQDTGKCIGCRDNTLGDNCEFCKKSHYQINYGNGYTECRMCPCPGPFDTNVFADSCKFDQNSNKVYYCQCQPGYSGQYCERCAPGHFGDPTIPGGKCLPCQCNDNIDLSDYDACDQRTGLCRNCLNHTTGLNCEKCAEWHYGDALALKNCQPCECNQTGTSTCSSNGECVCKSNVIGYNCASCKENMWGFQFGEGCKECNCNPTGSVSLQCNTNSGQCVCKPGVRGQKCDQCLPDHWNFTAVGCQKCECERDGVIVTETGGYACNQNTGHCKCIEGVKGAKCDECDDRWVLVKHVGCKKCDTCVNTLLDDVEELFVKTSEIENGNKNYSLTFKAHNKLTKLEEELDLVKGSNDPSQYEATPLLSLKRTISQVQEDLNSLKLMAEYDINDKIKLLTSLLSDAELFNKDVSGLRLKLDLLDQIIEELDREDLKSFKNITDEHVNFYEGIVDQIVKKDFLGAIEKHKDLLDQFEKANGTVQNLKKNFDIHSGDIDSIKAKNLYIQKSLVEMKSLIDKAKSLDKLKDKDIEFKAYFDNLEQVKNETISLQANSTQALNAIEKNLKQGQEKLDQSNKDLADLNSKVNDLNELYVDHDSNYQDLRQKCLQAEQKAQSLALTGQSWRNKVLQLQNGLEAYETVRVYENIADQLNSAHAKSQETLSKYKAAETSLDDFSQKSDRLKASGDDLTLQTNEQLEKRSKLESDYTNLNKLFHDLERKSRDLNKSLERVDQWMGKTLASDQTLINLKKELDEQQKDLDNNEQKANDLVRKIQSLDALRESLPKPETADSESSSATKGERLLKSIEASIENLKTQGPNVNTNVKKLLENNDFNTDLEKISKEIYELKMLIDSTRQIANDIKVAVNFNDSSIIHLKAPADLHPSMTTASSLYLKTREYFAPIALIYNESNPNEYFSLYLQQGRVHFQYKLSSNDNAQVNVLATEQPINDGEWHKLEVERVGKSATLKIYSNGNYQEKSKVAQDDSVVFNLDSNGAKFILGQFPFAQISNELKTIAAYNNQFRGTLDAVKFNGQNLGKISRKF